MRVGVVTEQEEYSVLEVQGTDLSEVSEQSKALHWLPELSGNFRDCSQFG